MQFSFAVFIIAASTVSAGPLLMRKGTCDIETCVLDLAPAVVGCGAAAAEAGANPFADATCVIAAAKDVDDLPDSCNGCDDQLGISSAIDSAKNAIEGLF
ncbi:hypothetical protein DFH08DRAFT_962847 [Mycena albidolilacea]|uniref:Fungal calcium binding protein domain-containing protein n=1 Tax=Mycena albidolilacea TaxID=1033008 RepID=A0AAD7ENG2_9AGAR|nr:hypothetical protein DFH08DRAFT_962847 [Mycena albidolilacea]